MTDIALVSNMARQALPEGRLTIVVDATWATPVILRPLALGADFVLHSCTKYIGGHSDVLGGVVVGGSTGTAVALDSKLRLAQQLCGGVMGPWESYMSLRGLRTLHVRMERHCRNALEVANFLASHKNVSDVLYPGLPSHSQHLLARQQMKNM